MIERSNVLPLTRQASLLRLSRSSVYYLPRPVPPARLAIMHRIDALHLAPPFAGSRMLRAEGITIGRLAVTTLMRRMAAYTPLADEVRSLLAARPEALQVELLQQPDFAWSPDWTPRWETIGRERVATGRYTDAISYARHVRPIALSLGAAAGATGREGQRYRHPRHDPGA